MPYGTIKVDTITFTNAGVDKSVSISGLVQNPTFTGNVTATGTISGLIVQAPTVTGTTANFASGVYTTQISGAIVKVPAGSAGAPSIQVGVGASVAPGLYGAGTDLLGISTGGAGRIFIDSTGRLGVGTSSPGTSLHVSGSATAPATFQTSNADLYLRLVNSVDPNGYIGYQSNALTLWTVNAERLRIDSSGRVGIGTSSPENKFEVIGDGNRIVCRNATNGGEARIEAQVQNYTSGSTFIGTAISQYGSTATGTTGGQANANLGVLTFQNTSTGLILTNGATPLVFGTASVERMRLTGIGTLALGTSVAPIGTHEFCWQGSHRCAFRNVDSTASNCNGLLIAYDNAAPNGTGNDFLLCTDNATTRAAIRSNGGIANFQANNVNLSDINLKKNILPANSTWEHLKQWEIVSYQYKDQSNESDLNFGVIAQQVAEISPEVITVFQKATQGEPDQLGVKEQQMYWMAIKALQEAVDRIETLEAKVAALEGA